MKTNAMKTLKLMLVSACLFASPWTCFAQEEEYHPFLENDKWLVTAHTTEGFGSYLFYISGDSTINGLVYYKLKMMNIELPNLLNDVRYTGISYDYFQMVREDVENRKVYYKSSSGWTNDEGLWYDFNLDQGAKIPNDTNYVLTKIDTVQINVGFRKRFVFHNSNNDSIIWVEGIGNIRNPFSSLAKIVFPPNYNYTYLLCAYKNGVISYDNSISLCNCQDYLNEGSGIKQVLVTTDYKVYPNPVKDRFTITLEDDLFNSLRIIGLDGNKQLAINSEFGSSSMSVNVSMLPSGMYFCIFTTGRGKKASFKLVKQ
jgi:Secretion system C-terminal sorting domain